jgi:predicted metal-dependent HD superfamily phosphohydrolase
MTTGQFEILTKAQDFINDHYNSHVNPSFVFHNLTHTQEVVAACEEMAEFYKLQDDDRFALSIAAWFHDSGYSKGVAKDHESESIRLATNFLQQQNVPADAIHKTVACIDATRLPQTPTSLISNIICDADLAHLGGPAFFEKSKLLRQEINATHDEKVNKKDWRKINIKFLEGHKYFTDYAKQKFDPIKQRNLAELKNKELIKDDKAKPSKAEEKKEEKKIEVKAAKKNLPVTPIVSADDKDKKKKEKDAADRNERGISTMFRIMSNSQTNLSAMADSKANIMISVNSIIISIMISGLLTVVISNPHLAVPFFLLVIVCVTAIVFSVLATRPKITSGRFTQEDIQNKKINLLFFGNFYNMNLQEYEWAMKELLNSRDYLYDSMIKDIYFLGIVLAKKYKYLRISYNIFMYGLILVIIAFAIAIFFFKPQAEVLG